MGISARNTRKERHMIYILLIMASAMTDALDIEELPGMAANEELCTYLEEAAENHPGLQALHGEWLATLQRIPQVTSLEDPMLTYKQFLRSSMSRIEIMLEQRFPWFGTLKLEGRRAAAEAEAAHARLFAERNTIYNQVKQYYFEYAFLAEQIRIVEAQLNLLDYTEETVRAKYALGLASQDELLRIQIMFDEVDDRRTQLLQFRPALSAQLNEVLGRPLQEERPWPMEYPQPSEPLEVTDITAIIQDANPAIKTYRHLIESRNIGIRLAQRKNYPEIRLGLEFMAQKEPGRISGDPFMPGKIGAYRSLARTATGAMPFSPSETAMDLYEGFLYREAMPRQKDEFAVSIGINIPIWRKRIKAGVTEAKEMARAAERDREAAVRSLESEARMTLYEIQDAQRRYRLYDEALLPKGRLSFESLLAAYATGGERANFLDVLESLQNLLDFELEQSRALRDWQQSAAELEFLLGYPGEPVKSD